MKKVLVFVSDKRNALPLILILLSVLLSAVLLGYCVTSFLLNRSDKIDEDELSQENETVSAALSGVVSDYVNPSSESLEMRGVWIASVSNINFPHSQNLSSSELALELDRIVDVCHKAGFNAIFFQVRPASDALYDSDIFPWSEFLTGEQGRIPDNGFDPLSYLLIKAHEKSIAVHAWINPYRITTGSVANPKHDVNELSKNNPARKHPEYTVAYDDGKLYYNPGLPEVRKLCVDGVLEILTKYPEIDGIHFDDYFYPYPVEGGTFDDTDAFEKYGRGMSLADWRRENVNMLIRETYEAIKNTKPDCAFGVSPFGIWANSTSNTPVEGSESAGLESYSSLYCDTLTWVNEKCVDYIAPQLYWSFTSNAAPFDNMARWWNSNLDGTGVDLYVGHAAYKAPDFGDNEIAIQTEFCSSLISYKGSIFYGYEDIADNTCGLFDTLSQMYSDSKRLPAVKRTGEPLKINTPSESSTVDFPAVYLMGTSDPAFPVYHNGEKLSRTRDGYFYIYSELAEGANRFRLTQNKTDYEYVINRTIPDETPITADKYAISKCYPSGDYWAMSGEVLELMVQAPVGSEVTARIGESISVNLTPTIGFSSGDPDVIEVYKGTVEIPKVADDNSAAELGALKFTAIRGSESSEVVVGNVKELALGVYIFAEVKNDYTYVKAEPDSSFYDDYTPVNKGMRAYVTGLEQDYYRLDFGGYVHKDDVEIYEGVSLSHGIVKDITVESVVTDSVNNIENHTEVRFGITENIPCDIDVADGIMTVTFFSDKNPSVPVAQIKDNPMVSEVRAVSFGEENTVFEILLKDSRNFYGFNGVYENGAFVLRLNNPQTLADGDKPLTGKTIVVDAGHGGNDTGASGPCGSGGGNINESSLNLAIALELEKELKNLGANVIMTRQDDTAYALLDRVEFLSGITPDLFVSVHHNSVDTSVNASKVRGTLALYSHEGGKLLAECVGKSMALNLGKLYRETSYQKLAVARNHRFPAVLCEVCFVSNVEEYQWSVTDGNDVRSACAIAEGILDYYVAQSEFIN